MHRHKKFSFMMFFVVVTLLLSGCFQVANFNIQFNSNGGTEVSAITTDGQSIISIPDNPTREGFVFDGWFWDNHTFLRPFTANSLMDEPISSNMTVYAKWIAEEEIVENYTVTFHAKGGSAVSTQVVASGSLLMSPTAPTRVGHVFGGWYTSDDGGTTLQSEWNFSSQSVAGSFTLYAKWTVQTYMVQFLNEDGSLIHQVEVEHGQNAIAPSNPTKEGFTFAGWDKSLSNITANQQIRARYESAITYVITFDVAGGVPIEALDGLVFGQSVTLPTPIKAGYQFLEWKWNEDSVDFITTVESNMRLTALWELDPDAYDVVVTLRIPAGTLATQIQSLVEHFNALYRIKVELDIVGGFNDVRNLTISDLQMNQAPTMVIGYPEHFAEYYSGGALLNLNGFVEGDEGYTTEQLEDFIASFLDEGKGFDTNHPDHLYTLPFSKSTEVLLYNKTILDALAVLAPDDIFVPTTWEEVQSVSAKIVELVQAGHADTILAEYVHQTPPSQLLSQGRFTPLVVDSSSNAFITMAKQWGGTYTERLTIDKGLIRFHNDPAVLDGLSYFQNEAAAGRYATASMFGVSYASEAFKYLQTFMVVSSSAGIRYYIPNNQAFEVGVAKIPYVGAQSDNKSVLMQGSNIGILQPSTEAEQEAAWKFIQFLLDPSNTVGYAVLTGYIPLRHSAFTTPTYINFVEESIDQNHYVKVLKVVEDYISDGYEFFSPDVFIGLGKVRLEIEALFDDVLKHPNQDIQDLLDQAQYVLGEAFAEQTEELAGPTMATQNILLGSDIVGLKDNLHLPAFVYVDGVQIAIQWEISGSSHFSLSNTASNGFYRLNVSSPKADANQEKAVLKARVVYEDEPHIREWMVYLQPVASIPSLTIAEIKMASNQERVEVIATVSYVHSTGFMIHDETGGLYVHLGTSLQEGIVPGALVRISGTRATFFAMPQITQPTIEVIEAALETGFDYSIAQEVEISELLDATTANLEQFGKMVRITGEVVKDVQSSTGANISQYGIKDIESNQIVVIHNSSSQSLKDELEALVGEQVSIVVIVQDFHNTHFVWRSWGVDETIEIEE